MTFEQLNAVTQGVLLESGISALSSEKEKLLARIRQGGDAVFSGWNEEVFCMATALSAIMKAPKAFEGSPRVLILSPSVESACALHHGLTELTRKTEIAVELAHDKGNKILQRNAIFDGADIIVGNPKRMLELYNQNGIHVGQVTLFLIEKCDTMFKDPLTVQPIVRLSESLPKCQRILLCKTVTPRLEKLVEEVCIAPKFISVEHEIRS